MPLIRTPTDEEIIRAILAGNRGEVIFDYQYWQSNISGKKLYKIDAVESATVNLSNYRDYTWELGINLLEDATIDPFLDYVKVIVRIRTSEDAWIEFPFGLYRLSEPRGSDNPFFTSWDLTGKSLEIILLDNMAAAGYKVASGTGVLSAVRTILVAQGIPASRINFPSADVNLTEDMVFSPFQDQESCYWLRICNALLAAGGFYAIHTDAEGYFTTKDIEEGAERETAITYLANAIEGDEGEELVTEEIGWEYEEEFYNKVVVYSADTEQDPPIVAVAELHNQSVSAPNAWTYIVVDEENAFAYEALGNRFFTRPPEAYQGIRTDTEARKLAKALLRRTATRHVKLTIPTMPDPRRGPREDYILKARRSNGDVLYNSKYRVVGWTLPLDAQSAMSHEVNRTLRGG